MKNHHRPKGAFLKRSLRGWQRLFYSTLNKKTSSIDLQISQFQSTCAKIRTAQGASGWIHHAWPGPNNSLSSSGRSNENLAKAASGQTISRIKKIKLVLYSVTVNRCSLKENKFSMKLENCKSLCCLMKLNKSTSHRDHLLENSINKSNQTRKIEKRFTKFTWDKAMFNWRRVGIRPSVVSGFWGDGWSTARL